MADRFVVGNRGPGANGHAPGFGSDRTGTFAVRTQLLSAEQFSLGPEDLFDGPLEQRLGDIDGQRLDGVEIEIESGSGLTEGAAAHDFSPAVGEIADLRRIRGLALGERHRQFVLELGDRRKLEKSA
jgi:hypothetical protein